MKKRIERKEVLKRQKELNAETYRLVAKYEKLRNNINNENNHQPKG